MKKSGPKIKNKYLPGKIPPPHSSFSGSLPMFEGHSDARLPGLQSEHSSSLVKARVNFLADILETTPQPFCAMSSDGRITAYNKAFLGMTTYTAGELAEKSWTCDLTPPEWREQERAILEALRQTGRPQFYQKEYIRKDGLTVPVEISAHHVVEKSSGDFIFCSFIRDITERKRVEAELQTANGNLSNYIKELEAHNRDAELFSEMVSLLQACVTAEEVQSVIVRLARGLFAAEYGSLYLFNPAHDLLEPVAAWGNENAEGSGLPTRECRAFRLGRMYVVDGKNPEMLCSHIKGRVHAASLCVPLMAQGEILGLLHLQFDEGWMDLSEEARERQKQHKQRLAVAVAENIALSLGNFKLRDSLYVQSIRDYLTGLYNRRYMAELLEKELRRMARKKQTAGVIIIDIDRFKSFNDTYGHEAGDLVLREFSAFLRKHVREEDFACRYGGDEFVIILPEASRENTRQRAQQLREGAKQIKLVFRGEPLDGVTLSIGMAVYPPDGSSVDEILSAADAALYQAKAEGRDRVVTA